MTVLARLCLAVAVAAAVAIGEPAAQAADGSLAGDYAGFAASHGVAATLVEDNARVRGRFVDAQGRIYAINGQRVGMGAQGALVGGAERSFFRVDPQGPGIRFLHIPAGPDGAPDMAAASPAQLMPRDADDVAAGSGGSD